LQNSKVFNGGRQVISKGFHWRIWSMIIRRLWLVHSKSHKGQN
jgi:hypothetical protein